MVEISSMFCVSFVLERNNKELAIKSVRLNAKLLVLSLLVTN